MKKIKYLILPLIALAAFSCIDEDNDALTGNAITGGLVSLDAEAIGYVVGNDGTYTISGSVYQGRVQTTNVDIYKSFTSGKKNSNEILFTSLPISNTTISENGTFEYSFKYEDLIEGLNVDGVDLPTSDSELTIGDFWTLRLASTTSEGNVNFNARTARVSVGTRFAGLYNVIESVYWRIGVRRDDVEWPDEMLIESVDATTYRVVEYFGAFNGNEYYFQIDENDRITYPNLTPDGDPQTGNGQPLTTCEANPGDLTNVPCGMLSNLVIRDDVNGKDQLKMTFGYFTAGSGPREFYQVLEKKTE